MTVSAPDALIHPARHQRLAIARAQTVPSVTDLFEEFVRLKRRPQQAMRLMLPGSEQIVGDFVCESASERSPQNKIGERVWQVVDSLSADGDCRDEIPDISRPDVCEGRPARVARLTQGRQHADRLRRRRALLLQEHDEAAVRSGEAWASRIVPHNPDVQRRPDLLRLANHLIDRLEADAADSWRATMDEVHSERLSWRQSIR